MKKTLIKSGSLILLTMTIIACGNVKKEPYESLKGKEADYTFSFTSDLPKEAVNIPSSTGRKIYFANSSNSLNADGSEENPYQSLEDIKKLTLIPGDEVLFKCGDTFEGNLAFTNVSGEDQNPITFTSYGEGEKPIIYSKSMTAMSFEKSSNIVVKGLKVKVDGVSRTHASGECRYGIKFNYNYVGQEKYRNIYILDNEVEGNGTQMNLMGISIDSMESTHEKAPDHVLTNCYILNNTVHNLGRSGIKCSGWLANERTNQNNSSMTLYENFHFDNNHVYDIGCIGIYIVGCTNSTMNRNLVHNIGVYIQDENKAIQTMEGECGIMALGTDTCDIQFNEVYDCYDQGTGFDAMGIDIDWNTTNVNVQYNYLHDCQGPGVGTMANQNSFIRNNYILNCRGDTNQQGSLVVSNFTSRYACVDESMHAVKNLLIEDNLVIQSVSNKSLFTVWPSNGDDNYENNVFAGNHLIYNGLDINDTYFVNVDPSLPWYKFANNKYYSLNTDVFKVMEATSAAYINITEGAQPYTPSRNDAFQAWQKRDLGATYELLKDTIPSSLKNVKVTYEEEKIHITFSETGKDAWHYNLYDVAFDEDADYRNMIGECFDGSFSYKPSTSGDHYIIIQPESATGIYGKALKIKVSL